MTQPTPTTDDLETAVSRPKTFEFGAVSRDKRNCPVAVMKTARWWP